MQKLQLYSINRNKVLCFFANCFAKDRKESLNAKTVCNIILLTQRNIKMKI